jgi:hypothetical protein
MVPVQICFVPDQSLDQTHLIWSPTREKMMLRRVYPTEEQFEVGADQVTHKPTNAMWSALPGLAEPYAFRRSMLGSRLSDGDDYWEGEVAAFARKLLADRLKRQ